MSSTVLGAMALLSAAVSDRPAALSTNWEIEREAAARDCPDAASLRASVSDILGARVDDSAHDTAKVRAHVAFARTDEGLEAAIQLRGAREGQRTLTDAGPGCAALGRAVAVALALLLEAEKDAASARPAPNETPKRLSGKAQVRGGLAWGDVGAASGTVGGELGLGLGERLSFWLGGERVFTRTTALGPGAVAVSLWSAHAAFCGRLNATSSFVSLALCGLASRGALKGQGQGLARDQSTTLAWWAAGLGVRAQVPLSRLWYAALALEGEVPLYDYTFSVAEGSSVRGSSRWLGHLLMGVGVELW